MNLQKGYYITIEGIDGSGKTTLANNLTKLLKEKYHAVQTKEPSQGSIGQLIRQFLTTKIKLEQKAQFLLFAADRAQHYKEVIEPALNNKNIVISDRSGDSSTAYQGYGLGLEIGIIQQINRWVTNGLKPDIIIYLKLTPELAMQRVTKRNEEISEFENLTLLHKVSDGFDEIFKKRDNVIILDASQDQHELLQQATLEINKVIK